MKPIATLVFLLLATLAVSSQEIAQADLEKLSGSWTGTLSYTDYGDDSSRYVLETRMEASWQGKKEVLEFEYKEPNGSIVKGKQSLKISKRSHEVYYNGSWPVSKFTPTPGGWELSLVKPGKDNNRAALIQQKLVLDGGNTLTITKMVKYEGTDDYFQRNQYVLKK